VEHSVIGHEGLFVVIVFIVIMMIIVSIMIVIVAFTVVIRVVVVFNAATIAFPVASVISFSVVAGWNPTRSFVRWTSPIAFVPFVVFARGVPIALDPRVPWSWAWRNHCDHARWRWCSNNNSN
jgi:hypothetical protein